MISYHYQEQKYRKMKIKKEKDRLLILLIKRTFYRAIASLIFILLLISTFLNEKTIENKLGLRILYSALSLIFILLSIKYYSLLKKHKRIIK